MYDFIPRQNKGEIKRGKKNNKEERLVQIVTNTYS
jgi:hypothetical protein